MDTIFLDANILFSAAYRPDAGLRRLWTLENVEIITSAYAVEEARRNLDTPEQRAALEELLSAVKVLAPLPQDTSQLLPSGVNLPDKDRPILLAAIRARATHLLTGDGKHFGEYYGQTVEGVHILQPAAYLRIQSQQ